MPEKVIERGLYALCKECGFHTGNVRKVRFCPRCGCVMIACDIVIRWKEGGVV